ncbi:MAG: hypothetical protein AAGI13_11150 [Pseudomonadota bacterium]
MRHLPRLLLAPCSWSFACHNPVTGRVICTLRMAALRKWRERIPFIHTHSPKTPQFLTVCVAWVKTLIGSISISEARWRDVLPVLAVIYAVLLPLALALFAQ